MKKEILTGLAGIILTGCSTIEPAGHIGVSYVPDRADSQIYNNELAIDVEAGLESRISDDTTIYLAGRHKAYIEPQNNSYTFNVNSHEYGVIGEVEKGPLLFFAERYCMHPVNDTEEWVTDDEGRYHYTNHRSRTEIGIKYRW